MERTGGVLGRLCSWAAMLMLPASALAQSVAQSHGPVSTGSAETATGDGSGWLKVLGVLVVLAGIWWGRRQRQGRVTRRR